MILEVERQGAGFSLMVLGITSIGLTGKRFAGIKRLMVIGTISTRITRCTQAG